MITDIFDVNNYRESFQQLWREIQTICSKDMSNMDIVTIIGLLDHEKTKVDSEIMSAAQIIKQLEKDSQKKIFLNCIVQWMNCAINTVISFTSEIQKDAIVSTKKMIEETKLVTSFDMMCKRVAKLTLYDYQLARMKTMISRYLLIGENRDVKLKFQLLQEFARKINNDENNIFIVDVYEIELPEQEDKEIES